MATKKPTAAKPAATSFDNIVAVTLAQIVAAGAEGMFTNAAVHGPMVEQGLVEINPGITNEAGEVATRATQKGIETVNQNQTNNSAAPSAAPSTSAAVKSAFKLDDAVSLPVIKRGGRGGNVYPFDEMAVMQSFFVAADADKPDPAKSLASTVSSATARYAVEVPGETEVVKVKNYKTGEDGKRIKGEDGKLILESETTEIRPKMVETRKFVVRSVVENNIKGARIWRTA